MELAAATPPIDKYVPAWGVLYGVPPLQHSLPLQPCLNEVQDRAMTIGRNFRDLLAVW